MRKKIFAVVIGIIAWCPLFSQDLDSLLDLNAFTEESELQQILNKDVSLSTQKLSARETPGIVSVITGDEIRNSGARDLTDVLRLVPGFEIMQDLQFVMGLGLRGSWANEGKVLVLMDGHQMNELLYQTVTVGNRFPVDAIERIEIIRGPGSAIYGGSAEYGVINIITRAASSLNGVGMYVTSGLHSGAVGRTNAGFMMGHKAGEVSWDLSFFGGRGIVSEEKSFDDPLRDLNGEDLTKTHADPFNINAGMKYKGLAARVMYDEYETNDPQSFISYKGFFTDLRYTWKVSDKLQVIPQFRYLNQVPWVYGSVESHEADFESRAVRTLGQVDAQYTITRKSSVVFGALYFHDKGIDLLEGAGFGGENSMTLNNYAFFAQGLFKHRLANTTIGFRYEKNNRYGAAFVPRLALTKKIENLHFKVLYSQAFRAPSIQNINIALNGESKPEKSDVFEVELGYQFTPEMLLAVNAFSISTRDVLIYGSEGENETFNEWYENYDKSGSRGIEAVYTIRQKRWYATLTYSFNQALPENTVDKYEVPQTNQQFVGFPADKFTLNANVSLTEKLSFNTSVISCGKRYAFTRLDTNDEPEATELDPYTLVHVFMSYKNVLPALTLGAGIYDLFDVRPGIPQAYNGGFAPIPARSREFVFKISYQFDFKSR